MRVEDWLATSQHVVDDDVEGLLAWQMMLRYCNVALVLRVQGKRMLATAALGMMRESFRRLENRDRIIGS